MKLIQVVSLAAIGVQACQREFFARNGHHRHSVRRRDVTPAPTLDANEATLLSSFDSTSIASWSYYYTHGYHVAGSNKTMAEWTVDRWNEFGFTSRLDEYYVYLNYPVSHSLALNYANGSSFQATLAEEVLAEDDTTSYPNRVPTFHGYSATGNASAQYVYVGRGQQVDFERLKALGVPLEGKIALAKYGGPFRGLKVKNAQEHGMIGCIVFTDPGDDGNVTEAKGYAAYPDGPARNPSSVQRGSVQFLSTYPGDPTTPGYASKKGVPRADKSTTVPKIPSLPISWLEAVPLLAALDGHGTAGEEVNRTKWVGALNVSYSTGPSPPGTTISMSNVMEDTTTSIWNGIGVINGTNQDEVIIVGNHRDAWIVGGAADPNSGSAIMIELSKAFSKLLKQGWKPRRTIVLASWDAEEYGLVGSTEWVEEYIPWLEGAVVSYLNIDVGVSGPIPYIDATPDLHDIGLEVMKKVTWPYRGTANRTLYDVWYEENEGEVGVLGSGSDFTSFVHRGISSMDMGAGGGPDDPIYHYHSNYDSYHWMSTFGDPGFVSHKAMGQYLSLLLYRLSSDALLPNNPQTFSTEMAHYLSDLNDTLSTSDPPITLDLSPLQSAITTFSTNAKQASAVAAAAGSNSTTLLSEANGKIRDFSRGFTSQGGLPGREFYRHVLFAPGIDTGYAPVTFPGITEAVEAGNQSLAAEWVLKTAKGIEVAAEILKV